VTAPATEPRRPGRCFTGTSGFAYPGWIPRFYPPGSRPDDLLRHYATRLPAVELNNTFYQRPSATKVATWLEATPATFRFCAKAQRGAASMAMAGAPEPGLPWLTDPFRAFGERLGTVLVRVPAGRGRDDGRLAAFLAAWPRDLPLTMEFEDPSWAADETMVALTAAGAALCVTERPEDAAPPVLRRTGPLLYLRLRRHDYTPAELGAWAARLEPFIRVGDDVYAFFRHDEAGRGPELALELAAAVNRALDPGVRTRPDRTPR
jgi:uncharacterized protein YecE (DUF72 family)